MNPTAAGAALSDRGSVEKDVIIIGFRYLTSDGCHGFGPMYAISYTREQVTDPRYESSPCTGRASGEVDLGGVGAGPAKAGPDSEMRKDSSTASGSITIRSLTPPEPEEGLGS